MLIHKKGATILQIVEDLALGLFWLQVMGPN